MSDVALGSVLANRYRIDAAIGRGGMAEVYRGVDVVLERPVAIKILTDRASDVRKRFLREAQSMAMLNHRNIVGVYDAGESGELSFIVMELIDGRTLRDIPVAELTMRKAVRYFVDLLEALQYAHTANIVHRDIKPTNIMVLTDGTVKVMDFGLSRRTTEMSNATQAGEIVGTIAYISPERFLGKSADARSDLYAVGVVMYELFTGTLPFKHPNDDLVAIIFAHVNEQPAPPRSVNRSVPAPLERIILRLLEKDPERRYQSAQEVARELEGLITEQPGKTGAPAPSTSFAAAAIERRGAEAEPSVRETLTRVLGPGQLAAEAQSQILTGMLAARKGKWDEAARAYRAAMDALKSTNNDLEYAKTASKFGTMLMQKITAGGGGRAEIESGVALLLEIIPIYRGRRMFAELEDSERMLYMLQRAAVTYT